MSATYPLKHTHTPTVHHHSVINLTAERHITHILTSCLYQAGGPERRLCEADTSQKASTSVGAEL